MRFIICEAPNLLISVKHVLEQSVVVLARVPRADARTSAGASQLGSGVLQVGTPESDGTSGRPVAAVSIPKSQALSTPILH